MFVQLIEYARITGVDSGVSVIGDPSTALDVLTSEYVQWTGAATYGGATGVDVIFPTLDIPSGATLPGTSTPGVEWHFQFVYRNPGAGSGQPVASAPSLGVTLVPPGFGRITAAHGLVGDDSISFTTESDIPILRGGLVARLMSDAIDSDDFRVDLFRLWVSFEAAVGGSTMRKYPNPTGLGVGPKRYWPRPRRGITGLR